MEERKKKKTASEVINTDENFQRIIKKMDTIQKQLTSSEMLNSEAIFMSVVKASGNSGHIPISKKYLGRKVKIILLKKEEDIKENHI